VVCWIRRRQIEKKIRKSKEKKMSGISRISIKKENPRGIQGKMRAWKRVTQCTTVRFLV
jgi:hypothetical protein